MSHSDSLYDSTGELSMEGGEVQESHIPRDQNHVFTSQIWYTT